MKQRFTVSPDATNEPASSATERGARLAERSNQDSQRSAMPPSIPEMNRFCRTKYKITIGRATITPAADSSE